MIDHRIRQVKLVTTRNRSLEDQVRALTVERDGLAAQLAEAREDAADARRAASYAEELATTTRERADALAGELDALRGRLETVAPRVSTSRRLHKGA